MGGMATRTEHYGPCHCERCDPSAAPWPRPCPRDCEGFVHLEARVDRYPEPDWWLWACDRCGYDGEGNYVPARLGMSGSGWIPVKDRLPAEGDEVLAYDGHETCLVVYVPYVDGEPGRWVSSDGYPVRVTHWMPLPEPPPVE